MTIYQIVLLILIGIAIYGWDIITIWESVSLCGENFEHFKEKLSSLGWRYFFLIPSTILITMVFIRLCR